MSKHARNRKGKATIEMPHSALSMFFAILYQAINKKTPTFHIAMKGRIHLIIYIACFYYICNLLSSVSISVFIALALSAAASAKASVLSA